MLIRSFKIENFKCFKATDTIPLESGFNVFIGQNNSGKSSIIEALRLVSFNRPHLTSIDHSLELVDPACKLQIDLEINAPEFKRFLLKNDQSGGIPVEEYAGVQAGFDPSNYLRTFFDKGTFGCEVSFSSHSGVTINRPFAHSLIKNQYGSSSIQFRPTSDKKNLELTGYGAGGNDIETKMWSAYNGSTFHFDPQRIITGRSGYNDAITLSADASNLARCILQLNENPVLHEKFCSLVNAIIPSIKWIVATNPHGQNTTEVKISAIEKESFVPEQLIRLSESGTGVGQVLAILFAAITFKEPRIIMIDEPNSFLHPAASKKLIEILKEYDHHQYLLTTHSSEIISAAEPKMLHLTRWTGKESVIEKGRGSNLRHKELVLAELGVSMADVFGANAIVWVEGMTEQLCFPKLLNASSNKNREDVKFVGLKEVGQFDKAKLSAKLLWDAYEKLAQADAITPPTIAFCLDREGRKKAEIIEIEKLSKNKVRFLPRRNYEAYLLHPDAISAVLGSIEYDEEMDLSSTKISNLMKFHASEKKLKGSSNWNGDLTDAKWLAEVDAANLLQRVFATATASKLEFSKVSHSTALTDWLLVNDSQFLKEVINFVENVVVQKPVKWDSLKPD